MRRILTGPSGNADTLNSQFDNVMTKAEEISEDKEVVSKEYSDFIEWLNEQLESLKRYSNLSSDPQFSELNDCLAHYEGVMLGMVSAYNVLKFEAYLAQRDYDEKFGEIYTQVRMTENPKDIAATKYLGQKELEYIVKSQHKDVLNPLETKAINLNLKVSALKAMIDSWNTYNFTLGTISKNVQAEANLSHGSNSELLDRPSSIPF